MSGLTFWFAFLLVISIFTRYFILPKIFSKDSKEFKKYVEEVIGMAKEGNDIAKKFCEDKGWDIK